MALTLLQQREGQFYHAFEAFGVEERERIKRAGLRDIIQIASTTAFYKDRLGSINVDDEHPLRDVPVLTSSDLQRNIPPNGTGLLTREFGTCSIFQSGGTTGVPKTSLFSYDELELVNQCNARSFFAVGLNDRDRVANLWAVGGLYMTFVHMHRTFTQYGCQNFAFSNHTPPEFVHSVAKLFNINVFTGAPSTVLSCLRDGFRKDPGGLKLEKIFFGGEHMYDEEKQEMKEKFGAEIILSPIYGGVDSWYIGHQCLQCPNRVFHAVDDMMYLEIVDEDRAAHCGPGEVGMLYATAYHRKLMPIIRYRLGDRGRWLKRACPCGRTTPLFELLGRGDDILRIGFHSIEYDVMLAMVTRISGPGCRLQMEKRRREGRDELVLRIETARPERDHEAMSRQLLEAIKNELAIHNSVQEGTIWPLAVHWLREGQLPLNERTGKLIRVIDVL